jgi:hypothetical protein
MSQNNCVLNFIRVFLWYIKQVQLHCAVLYNELFKIKINKNFFFLLNLSLNKALSKNISFDFNYSFIATNYNYITQATINDI